MQALGAELRHEPEGSLLAHAAVQFRPCKRGVEQDAGADEPRPVGAVRIEREDERQPMDEVGRHDVHQRTPLLVRLTHEPDVAHLEIPEAAMHQLG